ncbi:hypothetical protein BDY19DRAFT_66994 [Irpex rosettiformis]|uniref:Uncharacterized protein n=1 Tax=Irpex rosettiformis TaxID=378272 RepID=A0ACB8ULV9_9APHY|nr:hypothetical protein BDY19DRAFT_66994 [Irpex rosettiformis]
MLEGATFIQILQDNLLYCADTGYIGKQHPTSQLFAFLFLRPYTHSPSLPDGTSDTLHIWLARVLPEWRKVGCHQRMMDEIVTAPNSTYTVYTTSSLFPDMRAWLLKRGWKQKREFEKSKVMLSKRRTWSVIR